MILKDFRHGIDAGHAAVELQQALVDMPGVTFSTGDSDIAAILEQLGGIAAADHGRNA